MRYYVYENWTRDRGRVHKAECSDCNNGHGKSVVDSGKNGKWHGPFDARDLAFTAAKKLGRTDMRACGKCGP
jgi:hypothetical protein